MNCLIKLHWEAWGILRSSFKWKCSFQSNVIVVDGYVESSWVITRWKNVHYGTKLYGSNKIISFASYRCKM